MAIIHQLYIHQFRNLNQQNINLKKGINLFIGANGQGKTNLIEAVYYLSHNHSFKTTLFKNIVNTDNKFFQLAGNINHFQIKLKKSRQSTNILLNNQIIKSGSELAKILPIQVITPDKGFVVGGTPKNKRSYLDWGVFHVEPDFLPNLKQYNKILKNINHLLSSHQTNTIDFWLLELAKATVNINQHRQKYLNTLQKTSNKVLKELTNLFDYIKSFQYQFYSGWPKEVDALNIQSIYEYLVSHKSFFLKINHISQGSHKANIKFFLNSKEEGLLSRGEQKSLSLIFWLSQIYLLKQANINPVVLIDDLTSELDEQKIKSILYYLHTLDVQVLITNIKPLSDNIKLPINIFSIKKGKINPINS
jgi:DNA replication and repair protein RecF